MKQLFHGKHFDMIHDGQDYVAREVMKSPDHFFDNFLRITYDALIRPGDTVVEVGAHIGTHTLYLAKKARWVHAFEPQPQLFLNLCANLCWNDCQNVTPYQKACMATPGWLKADVSVSNYAVPDWNKASISFSASFEAKDFLRVWAAKLDDHDFGKVDFIKIDAEGHDWDVAQGGRDMIVRDRPFIVFEDNARQLAQWVEWLQPLDYTTVVLAENNYAMLPNERAAALKP